MHNSSKVDSTDPGKLIPINERRPLTRSLQGDKVPDAAKQRTAGYRCGSRGFVPQRNCKETFTPSSRTTTR